MHTITKGMFPIGRKVSVKIITDSRRSLARNNGRLTESTITGIVTKVTDSYALLDCGDIERRYRTVTFGNCVGYPELVGE
jgi:hypothetical protein